MRINQGFPRSGDAAEVLEGPMSQAQAYRLAPNLHPYLLHLSNVYIFFKTSK
jgi:hypothetical protein